MNVHLTAEQLEKYGRGALAADDRIRLGKHLAACDQCRSQIPFDFQRLDSLSVFQEPDASGDHLSYEMIEACSQSLIDDVDREIVTTHLEFCTECGDRIKNLQRFAVTLATPSVKESLVAVPAAPAPSSLWQRVSSVLKAPQWSYAIIGVAAALVIGIMIQQHGERVANGSLSSMSSISPAGSLPMIESAANAPATELPSLLKEVADRNATSTGSLFPGRVVIRNTKPSFQWEAVTGADSYQIEIRDDGDSVKSGPLSDTRWSPGFTLKRGRIYTWSVTAYASGQPLLNTLPAKATFGIISDTDERLLSETLTRFPKSHLLLAATYLNLGLLDESEAELNQIDSSTDDIAMKLRSRINGIRQAIK